MNEQDLERVIALVEQKYLSRRMEISEGRNILLLALVFEALDTQPGSEPIVFEAFMVQYRNPTTLEVENARKYIDSFKDKLGGK